MSSGDVKLLFGTAIRNQRAELRLSQEELADRAGLHRTYVSDVERGARNPSLETIRRLAQALERSVSTLFIQTEAGKRDERVEILLVEDNARDVELTMRAFRQSRLSNIVHVARDGADALDFIFAEGQHDRRANLPLPGVILLDLHLPKIGGLDVLRQLKSHERTRHIPVIVLTSSDDDRDIAACRELGVGTYIVKPVGFQKFSELAPLLEFDWALLKRSL
jgi:CheY-like chemotaxis protein